MTTARRLLESDRSTARMTRWVIVLMFAASSLIGVGTTSARTLDADDAWSSWQAVVARSNDGVNVRAEPDVASESLMAIADGTVVDLRLDETVSAIAADGTVWWPVRVDGVSGWVSGDFLDSSGGTASNESDRSNAPGSNLATPDFARGEDVAVLTDDGSGLVMRAGPSTSEERLAILGDGDVVQIVDGPFWNNGEGWYLVTDGNFSAYVFGPYLVAATASAPSNSSAAFAAGDYVTPEDGIAVNVRKQGTIGGRLVGVLQPGDIAAIVDGPVTDEAGDAWFLIDTPVGRGYALGSLLQYSAAPASPTTGAFGYPLAKYTFTQSFGCSPYEFEPYSSSLGCPFHNGIDLAASAGTPIGAADGGTVTFAGWCDCGLGYYVEIDHGNGFSTIYGHMLDVPPVSIGQVVNQGAVIGYVGSTGNSTGPHVHFMIELNGVPQDPLAYL